MMLLSSTRGRIAFSVVWFVYVYGKRDVGKHGAANDDSNLNLEHFGGIPTDASQSILADLNRLSAEEFEPGFVDEHERDQNDFNTHFMDVFKHKATNLVSAEADIATLPSNTAILKLSGYTTQLDHTFVQARSDMDTETMRVLKEKNSINRAISWQMSRAGICQTAWLETMECAHRLLKYPYDDQTQTMPDVWFTSQGQQFLDSVPRIGNSDFPLAWAHFLRDNTARMTLVTDLPLLLRQVQAKFEALNTQIVETPVYDDNGGTLKDQVLQFRQERQDKSKTKLRVKYTIPVLYHDIQQHVHARVSTCAGHPAPFTTQFTRPGLEQAVGRSKQLGQHIVAYTAAKNAATGKTESQEVLKPVQDAAQIVCEFQIDGETAPVLSASPCFSEQTLQGVETCMVTMASTRTAEMNKLVAQMNVALECAEDVSQTKLKLIEQTINQQISDITEAASDIDLIEKALKDKSRRPLPTSYLADTTSEWQDALRASESYDLHSTHKFQCELFTTIHYAWSNLQKSNNDLYADLLQNNAATGTTPDDSARVVADKVSSQLDAYLRSISDGIDLVVAKLVKNAKEETTYNTNLTEDTQLLGTPSFFGGAAATFRQYEKTQLEKHKVKLEGWRTALKTSLDGTKNKKLEFERSDDSTKKAMQTAYTTAVKTVHDNIIFTNTALQEGKNILNTARSNLNFVHRSSDAADLLVSLANTNLGTRRRERKLWLNQIEMTSKLVNVLRARLETSESSVTALHDQNKILISNLASLSSVVTDKFEQLTKDMVKQFDTGGSLSSLAKGSNMFKGTSENATEVDVDAKRAIGLANQLNTDDNLKTPKQTDDGSTIKPVKKKEPKVNHDNVDNKQTDDSDKNNSESKCQASASRIILLAVLLRLFNA